MRPTLLGFAEIALCLQPKTQATGFGWEQASFVWNTYLFGVGTSKMRFELPLVTRAFLKVAMARPIFLVRRLKGLSPLYVLSAMRDLVCGVSLKKIYKLHDDLLRRLEMESISFIQSLDPPT